MSINVKPLADRVVIKALDAEKEVKKVVIDFVDKLTGKQTIYQMMGLADMVRERGGEPLAPEAYKKQYLDRLWERIKDRVAGLKEGRPEDRTISLFGLKLQGVLGFGQLPVRLFHFSHGPAELDNRMRQAHRVFRQPLADRHGMFLAGVVTAGPAVQFVLG